jgi:hypothetical protein
MGERVAGEEEVGPQGVKTRIVRNSGSTTEMASLQLRTRKVNLYESGAREFGARSRKRSRYFDPGANGTLSAEGGPPTDFPSRLNRNH